MQKVKRSTDIVERHIKNNMLDHSYKDLAAVETKVIGKREENNYGEMEEETLLIKKVEKILKELLTKCMKILKKWIMLW